jgi:hypothetical protein
MKREGKEIVENEEERKKKLKRSQGRRELRGGMGERMKKERMNGREVLYVSYILVGFIRNLKMMTGVCLIPFHTYSTYT